MIRLKGFFLIVNCSMPIILVGALAIFAITLWSVVETELRPPVNQLISDARSLADEARNAARSVEQTASVVRAEAETVQNAASAMIAPLANFKIALPKLKLPFNQTISLDGINRILTDALTAPFSGMRANFDRISAAIGRARAEIDKLQPLGDAFKAQADQFQARADELSKARASIAERLGTLAKTAGIVIGLLLAWLVVGYLVWVYDRLAVGWHMLATGRRP